MAKIIEFYVPTSFRRKAPKWIPPDQFGKLIPFSGATTRAAGAKGRNVWGISLSRVVSRR